MLYTDTPLGDRKARTVVVGGGEIRRQTRPMARTYRVIDPEILGARLEERGWDYEIKKSPRSIWRHHLNVHLGDIGEGYYGSAAILCSHDGRTSLRIRPGATRGFCDNEFIGAPIRIAHTDPDIDVFLEDPDKFLREAVLRAQDLAVRVELLRRVPAEVYPLWTGLLQRKRLTKLYSQQSRHYPQDTAWGILQALSATKTPSLVQTASLAVADKYWERVSHGRLADVIPEILETTLRKPRKRRGRLPSAIDYYSCGQEGGAS